MTTRTLRLSKRRGAGMTEYIILCGLIALLVLMAVFNFKEQIRKTFVGSSGAVNNQVVGGIQGGSKGGSGAPARAPTKKNDTETGTDGNQYISKDGSTWTRA